MSAKTPGRIAYEACSEHHGTTWDDLLDTARKEWENIAAAVLARANPPAPQRCDYFLYITVEPEGFTSLNPPLWEVCSLQHEHGGSHVSWTRDGAWVQADRGQRYAQYRRKEN